MGILNINDLKEGMTLAADVKNKHGNIMIKQGMTLTEKHIMLLRPGASRMPTWRAPTGSSCTRRR